jgi:hypothetical protein
MGKYALHQAPLHHQAWPHGGAYSQLNTCACALCSLPLSRIGARALCSLSLGNARLDPSLSHAARALSHWGTCTVLSLSLSHCKRCVPFLPYAAMLSLYLMQLGGKEEAWGAGIARGALGRRNNKRRHGAQQQEEACVPKKARGGTGCIRRNSTRVGATACTASGRAGPFGHSGASIVVVF